MQRSIVSAALVGVLSVCACGGQQASTTGTGGSGNSSGSGGGNGGGTGGVPGTGGAPPACMASVQISGTADGTKIDRSYCRSVGETSAPAGWVTLDLYGDTSFSPATTATSVLWGDGAFSKTAPATGGILELPAEGANAALRLCLGAVTRTATDASSMSLSTFGTCPGQPTTDALTADYAIGDGGHVSGTLGGKSVNVIVQGFGCYGPACSLDLVGGGNLMVRLDGEAAPDPGSSAGIVEAFVRVPGTAAAVTVLCGSSQSKLSLSSAGDLTLMLAGLTSPGTCPGAAVAGEVTVTQL